MLKQILVLSGGGRKGVVKLSPSKHGEDRMAGVCSLDFRPKGAKLFIIGEQIAQIALDDINCEFEVPFAQDEAVGCVLRSSSVTMFGGDMKRGEMLSRIDAYLKREKKVAAPEPQDKKPPEETISTYDADVAPMGSARPIGDWTKYDGNNFYYAIKPQLDEMFVCYPAEMNLENSVPNSKWVRVDAEDGYYVVGLLFDNDEPSFICYGVPEPKDGNRAAPSELAGMCVWLPLSMSDIAGYWMIYQSAKTGEIIK